MVTKPVETLSIEKMPKPGRKPLQIVLDKSHFWTAFFSIIFASVITALAIYGQIATRISANAVCLPSQVKMSEFSGMGMSVTCVPLDTYVRMRRADKKKRKPAI